MRNFYRLIFATMFLALGMEVHSQSYVETYQAVFNSSFPTTATYGPLTTSSGYDRFYTYNTFDVVPGGDLTVSASFTNTRYTTNIGNTWESTESNGSVSTIPDYGLNFGMTTISNQTYKKFGRELRMEGLKSFYQSSTSYYSTDVGQPLDIANLVGFNMIVSTEGLNGDGSSTNGVYEMGKLTFTFNRAVDYPILHITGLGGYFLGTTATTNSTYPVFQYELPYTAELKSDGYDLTKLSGTSHTTLTGNRTISNDWSYTPDTDLYGTGGDESGTGSFRVEGTNVTTVTFTVYMRGKPYLMGDGSIAQGFDRWSSYAGPNPGVDGPDFAGHQSYGGDQFHAGWTLPIYPLTGRVLIDDDGGTLTVMHPWTDYTGDSAYAQLYAILVDDQGKIINVVNVAADGTFDFGVVMGDNYQVLVSSTDPGAYTSGVTDAPTSGTLPSGWYGSGQNFDSTNNSSTDVDYHDNKTLSYGVNYKTYVSSTDPLLLLAITRNPTILPVTLVSFTGTLEDKDAHLSWMTATEHNNSGFEVQYSGDGIHFENIGWVEGNGTTGVPHSYSFIHEGVGSGEHYYRLKQIDYDGVYEYSKIIVLESGQEQAIRLYPTPATTDIYIEHVANYERLNIYNSAGALMRKVELSGDNIQQLHVSDLSKGNYYIEFISNKGESKVLKAMIQ